MTSEWDEIAESWNRVRKKPLGEVYYFLSMIEWKGNVVGVGEGNGRNLLPFLKAGMEPVNVDPSLQMLKPWKGRAVVAEAHSLPFKDNSFDYTIAINSLHCIIDKAMREKAFAELFRVTRPGGLAMVSAWNRHEKRFLPFSILWPDVKVPWRIPGKGAVMRKYHLFTRKELEREMERTGFRVVEAFKGWDARESWFVVGRAEKD